ncbi:MAG: DUF1572 domain-containing protein [Pedobacter sp.]|nr:MAG: DUF1572 domain-containing protein [Pedobacter sp.]
MLAETLKLLFNRDLRKLKVEIESYRNESNLWLVEPEIANAAGNLCLHLIGNLNTYIGATLGGTNYVRNRPLEFSSKNIPQKELVSKIEETMLIVENTLEKVTEKDLASEYPLLVLEDTTSTAFFLVHLATHLSYHLGQINYHRRLLDK